MVEKCPDCGSEYEALGMHLCQSSCKYPPISGKQIEVLQGVLMGDGTIDTSGKTPCFRVNMVEREYLHHLDSLFPFYGQGVSLRETASQSADSAERNSPYEVNRDNYSDVYRWHTRRSPVFTRFAGWYETGEKVFPKVDLTPTVLKHWYVCDGYLHDEWNPRISINCSNEYGNENKIESMFEQKGIPKPDRWESRQRDGGINNKAWWNAEQTSRIFEYIGDPLPGFEYKWP